MPERRILLEGLCFPESPRWHECRLYFSDMRRDNRVVAVDLEGNAETICHIPGSPSGIGWLPDGRMIVVSMTETKILRLEPGGELVVHGDITAIARGPANDLVVDRIGRAYVGNFGFDMFAGAPSAPARLAMVHPSGFIRPVARDLAFPNGMVITPDGKTLIIAESAARQLTAFDIEVDGALMNRRVWADCAGASPDGICVDEEGAVWIAAPNKRAFIRFREGGEELERIQLPETHQAIACMLGGEDRRTLFMCTVEATTQQVLSGSTETRGYIEVIEVEVAGAGYP